MSLKYGYCIVSISPVRFEASDRAEMVTQLLFGEIVTVEEMKSPWMKITSFADNYHGYVDHKHIRFLTEKELNRWMDGLSVMPDLIRKIDTPWGNQHIFKGSYIPFEQTESFNIGQDQFRIETHQVHTLKSDAFEIALEYLNAPYLWGGKTPFGIDCSGLTQMVFRFMDINLPRDASQQIDYGSAIVFEDIEKGDVAFFNNADGRIIHVGIADGNGSIIHASGMVRIDRLNENGIVHANSGELTHTLHSIKRM
jgi:gamma-D-glutamyl-L-lysine dipeptidyl-peptidase